MIKVINQSTLKRATAGRPDGLPDFSSMIKVINQSTLKRATAGRPDGLPDFSVPSCGFFLFFLSFQAVEFWTHENRHIVTMTP
jgi:hypothetical protein